MDHWEEWQKVYQHGILVILPPDEVRGFVNQQREEYDPQSAAICDAHITLSQPLLQPLNESELINIKNIIKTFQPFEIHYGPLKSFLPYPCIWYEIQPTTRVLCIREALHKTGFFDLSQEHTDGFIPHMTVTEGLSGPDVNEELLTKLQERSPAGSFLCSQITLLRPDEDFSFQVHRHITLG
jgi:2'-5' RNA ligase